VWKRAGGSHGNRDKSTQEPSAGEPSANGCKEQGRGKPRAGGHTTTDSKGMYALRRCACRPARTGGAGAARQAGRGGGEPPPARCHTRWRTPITRRATTHALAAIAAAAAGRPTAAACKNGRSPSSAHVKMNRSQAVSHGPKGSGSSTVEYKNNKKAAEAVGKRPAKKRRAPARKGQGGELTDARAWCSPCHCCLAA
jgi:hypothetical protein